MRVTRVVCFIPILLFSIGMLQAQEVIRPPKQDLPLAERWRWATNEGGRKTSAEEYWIGYSIRRLMDQDSYLSSGDRSRGWSENRRSLYDVVAGKETVTPLNNRAWRNGSGNSILKVDKDVAILFKMSGDAREAPSLQDLVVSNMELSVDFEKRPLVWLGDADVDQSVELLRQIFGQTSSSVLKKDLVQAIGIHQASSVVFPFLSTIVRREGAEEVRAQAAFWIGQQDNPDVVRVLMDVVQSDHSMKVRDQAIFAISRVESAESTDALIALARKSIEPMVRAKAAFWLGQKASRKAVETLENIVADVEQTDVQRQALFGLARDHSREGVDRLIKIAQSHPNLSIRRQAIQCLGQSDDPRALEALIEIVRK